MGNKSIESYVNEAKRGNKESFGKLFELTYHKAYYTALKITENPKDAEDMVQEAYIKAFDSLETLKDDSKFEKWLNRIVANKCRDLAKKRKPELFSALETENDISFEETIENRDSSLLPQEIADCKAIRKLVMECIDSLPFEQRICVVMYYYNEFSVSEIAQSLSIPEGTVKSRLNKARKKLKKQIDRIEETNDIKLHSVAFPVILTAVFRISEDNCRIPIHSAFKMAKNIPEVLSDYHISAIIKTLGLTSLAKRVIAGVGAAVIITGGSMAAREIIDKQKELPATPSTTVTLLQTETSSASQTKKNKTHEINKTSKKHNDYYKISVDSSEFAVNDNNDNLYYIGSEGVIKSDAEGHKTRISSHHPGNLCIGSDLMYIYNGNLYRYNLKKLEKIMKVKGDYLYGDKYKLISISKDKNSAYLIDLNKKQCTRFKKNGSDFKYFGKKLYYRSNVNELNRVTIEKKAIRNEKLLYFDEEDDLKMPYYVLEDEIWHTGFDSDITGNYYVRDIESSKQNTFWMNDGICDFVAFQGCMYYSTPTKGLRFMKNTQGDALLAEGSYYCGATSKGNMIWCSTKDNETAYLIKSGESELYKIENGSQIIDFSVIDDTVYYRTDKEFGVKKITESNDTVNEIEFLDEKEENNYPFEYWVVPLSSQIKIGWKKDISDWVNIYISKDNDDFEYVDTTDEDYFIIDNLEHRTKYRIKLIVLYPDFQYEAEIQTVRVK